MYGSVFALFSFFSLNAALAANPPRFSDFQTQIYQGPVGLLDLSDKQAFNFRTRLREGAQQPVNFGGHFQVVEWGCGTGCLSGAMIDVLTGHVMFLPTIEISKMAAEGDKLKVLQYRPDSSLLIASGSIAGFDDGAEGWHFLKMQDGYLVNIQFIEYFPPTTLTKSNATPSQAPVQWQQPKETAPVQASPAINSSSPTPSAVKPSATILRPLSAIQNQYDISWSLVALTGLVIALLIYFLPSIIASSRGHHNARAIFILNLFLGWTFLGWVASLVWAFTAIIHPTNLQQTLRL